MALKRSNWKTQKALSQLQKITSNSKETEAQYEQASRLHQLLSGGNSKKIPLQQFILGIMLDDILTYANEFFLFSAVVAIV